MPEDEEVGPDRVRDDRMRSGAGGGGDPPPHEAATTTGAFRRQASGYPDRADGRAEAVRRGGEDGVPRMVRGDLQSVLGGGDGRVQLQDRASPPDERPDFAADFDRAMEQGYARLEAKRLETKRQAAQIGIEGDWDAPETDDMTDERMRRDPARARAAARRAGARRRPGGRKVASNAEVREALSKRLRAFRERIRARTRANSAARMALRARLHRLATVPQSAGRPVPRTGLGLPGQSIPTLVPGRI